MDPNGAAANAVVLLTRCDMPAQLVSTPLCVCPQHYHHCEPQLPRKETFYNQKCTVEIHNQSSPWG